MDITKLKAALIAHDKTKPKQSNFSTVYGFETSYLVWAKINRKLFCQILELEGN